MKEMSVHEFQSRLESAIGMVIESHDPLRVTGCGGEDFVVVSADDWDQEQETLYVLQSRPLMEQIERSMKTHREGTGYWFRPRSQGPVALWDGEPRRNSLDHDTIYD